MPEHLRSWRYPPLSSLTPFFSSVAYVAWISIFLGFLSLFISALGGCRSHHRRHCQKWHSIGRERQRYFPFVVCCPPTSFSSSISTFPRKNAPTPSLVTLDRPGVYSLISLGRCFPFLSWVVTSSHLEMSKGQGVFFDAVKKVGEAFKEFKYDDTDWTDGANNIIAVITLLTIHRCLKLCLVTL